MTVKLAPTAAVVGLPEITPALIKRTDSLSANQRISRGPAPSAIRVPISLVLRDIE